MYMTSAKTVQYIKKSSKGPDTSKTIEDSFSLKLNPGRPNMNAVIFYQKPFLKQLIEQGFFLDI